MVKKSKTMIKLYNHPSMKDLGLVMGLARLNFPAEDRRVSSSGPTWLHH